MQDTQVLKINSNNPEKKKIKQAAVILENGGLVAFPTETVYGIAALPREELAVEKLRHIKNRYSEKEFSLCIHSIRQVEELAKNMSTFAWKLIKQFWPGPLTLVLEGKQGKNVGLRMPDHLVAQLLLEELNSPVFAPSANLPGDPAPVSAEEVLKHLNQKIDLVIDSGLTRLQNSSTVCKVKNDEFEILRIGVITEEMIENVLKTKNILFVCTGNSCRSAMAEGLMKKMVVGAKDFSISSAGVAAFEEMPASREAIEVMKDAGVDISRHKARRLTDDMLKQSDYILVMEDGHKRHILSRFKEQRSKVFLLKEFAQEKKEDLTIHDPIGMSMDFYKKVAEELEKSIEGLVLKLK